MKRWLVLLSLLWAVPVGAQQEDVVAAHRQYYPSRLSPAQSAALLQEIAADLNAGDLPDVYGVLKDAGGNHCGSYECDIVCRVEGGQAEHWDVLTDSTDSTKDKPEGCTPDTACEDGKADGMYFGPSGPAWQPKGAVDSTRCIVVAGDVTPDPPACEACEEIATLKGALDSFATQLSKLEDAVVALEESLAALTGRVNTLEQAPAMVCEEVQVGTSRQMWHSHTVTVRACKSQP